MLNHNRIRPSTCPQKRGDGREVCLINQLTRQDAVKCRNRVVIRLQPLLKKVVGKEVVFVPRRDSNHLWHKFEVKGGLAKD